MSMRFCIYHLRINGGCNKIPGACNYPHKMGFEVANEYKRALDASKRGCPKCVEAAKTANGAGKSTVAQKRKAPSPEGGGRGGEDEGGGKRLKSYHNIVVVKNTALKFTDDNVPIEVECQIVGLGDRRLVGKIQTEQVSRSRDVKLGKIFGCLWRE